MFSKPSIKYDGEGMALLVCSIFAILLALFVFSISFGAALVIAAIGLTYVRIKQGQILGSSLLVNADTNFTVHNQLQNALAVLAIPAVRCHIVQSPVLNAFAMGYLNPFSIVLHSSIIENLHGKELDFILGHEAGHVAHGHTRVLSLIAPFGNTLPGLNILFGFWQRKAEYTADRAGLLASRDIKASVSAIIKVTCGPGTVGPKTVEQLLAQAKMIDSSPADMVSELFGTHPFLTNRIRKMFEYESSHMQNYKFTTLNRETTCKSCGTTLRFPRTRKNLRLTCPNCRQVSVVKGVSE